MVQQPWSEWPGSPNRDGGRKDQRFDESDAAGYQKRCRRRDLPEEAADGGRHNREEAHQMISNRKGVGKLSGQILT